MKNLATKMLRIMDKVSYIQKTGVNKFHNYKYARDSDVMAAFSKAFQEERVFPFCSVIERTCETTVVKETVRDVVKEKVNYLVTVMLQITFFDADSGEQFIGTFFGDGTDSLDKGLYKAVTGAYKYALLKAFCVATGDDPEQDIPTNKAVSERVQKVDRSEIQSFLEAAANEGVGAFRNAWQKLPKNQKDLVRDLLPNFKELAESVMV